MRILHVLKHSRQSNGHVHVAVDLACAQADAGHEVAFAHAWGSYDDLLRGHGVSLVEVPEVRSVSTAVRAERRLLRHARHFRPDVVHAHMMSSAVLAVPVARAVRAPLITTMHNSFDAHSALMRLGTVVVAVSDAERRRLLDRGFPPGKVVCVLNGVVDSPRESLPPDPAIGSIATPGVVSLSGLHGRKAVGDIIAAFAVALEDAPDWHLNVIGSGPDQPLLEAQVKALGREKAVHFLGPTLTPWPLLQKADVFVSASLDEPFGLNVAEARAAGCAVIATAVGGIPEVVDHGEAGQLVPPSDPTALARALRELMTNPKLLAQWQGRARAGVEHLSVRRMAAEYDEVYRKARG